MATSVSPEIARPGKQIITGTVQAAAGPAQVSFYPRERQHVDFSPEQTRSQLAKWLLMIFSCSILLHYGAVIAVSLTVADDAKRQVLIDRLSSIFTGLLPALTGLLGAAIAFYFKGKD